RTAVGAPTDQLADATTAQRLERGQQVDGLERVRLALRVRPVEDHEARALEIQLEGLEVAEALRREPERLQSSRIGMTTKKALSSSGSRSRQAASGCASSRITRSPSSTDRTSCR